MNDQPRATAPGEGLTTTWRMARAIVGLGLVALLVRGAEPRGADDPQRFTSENTPEEVTRALAATDDRPIVFADAAPPAAGVVALLADAARGRTVVVEPPQDLTPIRVTAPQAPVAMRRAALTVTVRGVPGETVEIAVEDGSRVPDTTFVRIGDDAVESFAFAVLPTRSGAVTWTVRAAGHEARASAWVRPQRAVRTLLVTGPPTWESRFLVRALEAAGGDVSVRQDLGRGQVVGTRAGSNRGDEAASTELDEFDVVAVLGPPGEGAFWSRLARWVAERGGGVMLAPGATGPMASPRGFVDAVGPMASPRGFVDAAGPVAPLIGVTDAAGSMLALWAPTGSRTRIAAESIRWAGPAELTPLPPADLVVPVQPVALPLGATPVAFTESAPGVVDRVVMGAGWLGRGRVVAAGLESWNWRMEGGEVEGHTAFWGSVVDWLAGGLRDAWTVSPEPGVHGVAWSGIVKGDLPESLPVRLPLTRPTRTATGVGVRAAEGAGVTGAVGVARAAGVAGVEREDGALTVHRPGQSGFGSNRGRVRFLPDDARGIRPERGLDPWSGGPTGHREGHLERIRPSDRRGGGCGAGCRGWPRPRWSCRSPLRRSSHGSCSWRSPRLRWLGGQRAGRVD